MIILPEFDPVAFSIGDFIQIRWYSLAYIAGIFSAMFWLQKCNESRKIMSAAAYANWLLWAILSIILGGRIGYVCFYDPSYFLQNPYEILAVWHGGMSFHGGLLGSIFGMWFFARKYKINFLELTDILAVAAPIGLFFGRIANFINMELYGRVTDSDFGVIFPNAGELPRHPSQLYEALGEGLLSFVILFSLYHFTKITQRKGVLSGLFLVLYASCRILIENFREPDSQIGFIFGEITMGQILSLPIILLGIWIIFSAKKSQKKIAKN
jgi:phosphatidylglycerol:prolipoprotein diacylglycerol transferase